MSELSRILNEANRENWSQRAIAKRATDAGYPLSHGSVSKYLNGIHGEPTAEILQAFADVFRIDVSILREAAGLPEVGEPFILPAEAAQLTGPEREAIKSLVRTIIQERKKRERYMVTVPAKQREAYRRFGRMPKFEREPKGNLLPEDLDLAAHPITDSPSMREHANGLDRGEESQEHPDDD